MCMDVYLYLYVQFVIVKDKSVRMFQPIRPTVCKLLSKKICGDFKKTIMNINFTIHELPVKVTDV